MDFDDTPEEAAFRHEARVWLAARARARGEGVASGASGYVGANKVWQRTLFDGGWVGLSWPVAYGGRGLDPMRVSIFGQEHAQFGESTGVFTVAIGMVGPTLIAHGSEEQKQRYLNAMLKGDEVWCQLFSEPGAGSDLAALGTRAEQDGDEWVVNGQKVWTSGAQNSDFGILLARSDPDAPKHRGITCFILDMRTPGIDVRPLRQITGTAHFNEVFLNDVRIPTANVVGAVNDGWRVAITTLTSERGAIGAAKGPIGFGEFVEAAQARGIIENPIVRQQLAHAFTRQELLRYFGLRLQSALSQSRMPGAEASVVKLLYSQNCERNAQLIGLLGAEGMLLDYANSEGMALQEYFLSQWASRIGGGTDQVQRNIVGERALGLPRDSDSSRDTPWKALVKG